MSPHLWATGLLGQCGAIVPCPCELFQGASVRRQRPSLAEPGHGHTYTEDYLPLISNSHVTASCGSILYLLNQARFLVA